MNIKDLEALTFAGPPPPGLNQESGSPSRTTPQQPTMYECYQFL